MSMKRRRTRSKKTRSFLAKLEKNVYEVDGVSRARALAGLAIAYLDENCIEEAREKFQEAAAISRTHADWDNAGWCEHTGAICLQELGRFEESLELLASCRQIFVDMGNLHAIAETDGVSFVSLVPSEGTTRPLSNLGPPSRFSTRWAQSPTRLCTRKSSGLLKGGWGASRSEIRATARR